MAHLRLSDRHLLPLGLLSRWRLRDARLTGQGIEVGEPSRCEEKRATRWVYQS